MPLLIAVESDVLLESVIDRGLEPCDDRSYVAQDIGGRVISIQI